MSEEKKKKKNEWYKARKVTFSLSLSLALALASAPRLRRLMLETKGDAIQVDERGGERATEVKHKNTSIFSPLILLRLPFFHSLLFSSSNYIVIIFRSTCYFLALARALVHARIFLCIAFRHKLMLLSLQQQQ